MDFKPFYLSFVILINLNHFVNSHSWVSCTDYKVTNNQPINYDINKCSGFPRDFESQYNSDLTRGFGYDTGYEFRSQGCRNPKNSNYNLKIANYVSGQEVCLIYPSKNHVAEYCNNNPFVPDNGLFISRSAQSNSDNFNVNYEHKNGKHQFGTVDYKGFQNCPGFCQNQDKTPCYVCFNLENDIPSGVYSFKWTWELNPGEYYTTCWDAQINGPNSPPSNSPPNSPPSNSPPNSPPSNSPPSNSPPSNSPLSNSPVDDHHDELCDEEELNKNYDDDQFSDENLIKNNPFNSMEEQCKSDDNVCKDNVNKRRDAYNKMLDRKNNPNNNQNNNNHHKKCNNQNNNNQNNNNQNNNNQNNNNQNNNPNLRTEIPNNYVSPNNNPLKYEYIENNICKV